MYLYVHYPTDVLGGVLVGILAGYGGYLLQYKRSRTSHPASRLGATYEFSIIIICTMRVSSRTNWSTVMLPSM